jgi:hypothetical protein
MSIFLCLSPLSKESVHVRGFFWIFVTRSFLGWGVVSPTPNPQAGGPPIVGCRRLLIHYICNYPPYLESRRMRWAGHVARMGERRNAYRILVWKPERKRPLGRPRCVWVDNIKMDLRDRMVWTGSNWLRLGTSGGLLWTRWWTFGFLKIAGNFRNVCIIGSFSGRAQLLK